MMAEAIVALPEIKVCPKCGTQYDRLALFCQRDGTTLSDPNAPPDPYIGKVLLDQFRIEQAVGQGGMGTVYRARQTSIGRDVAIKILHPELASNPDAVRRFQREARVSAALDHPNVVRVFLFGQLPEDGSLYIVMQYLEGWSLLDLLKREVRLPVSRALHIATQICDGVGEAHAQGVIHRDVKPENVILVQRGTDPDFVKVLDFGIARFVTGEQTVATQSGLIFGTARYISPEGAAGEPTDARSDVYSIGVLLYQMLVGVTPFDSSSPVALLMKHINDAAPDLRGQPGGGGLPTGVCDVVMRALAKNPDARFDDANELAAALRAAAAEDGVAVAGPRVSVLPVTPSDVVAPAGVPLPPIVHGSIPHTPQPLPPRTTTPTGPMRRDRAPTESLAVAGLGRKRMGTVPMLLLSFALGAVAVTGGVWVVTKVIDGGNEVDVATLEARARAALSRGDIDSPDDENVRALTDLILAVDPHHGGALSLRADAARRLRQEAEVARSQGYDDEARSRYRRVLLLVPGDDEAERGLAELDTLANGASSPPASDELTAVPPAPRLNDPVTLMVSLAEEPGESFAPVFEVERVGVRGTRRVEARNDGDRTHWVAPYVFRRAGAYRVTFGQPDDEARLTLELVVEGRAVAQGEPPVTTQVNPQHTTQTEQVRDQNDGIDWRLPDEVRPRVIVPTPTPPPVETPTPPPTTTPTPPPTETAPPPPPPPPPWSI